MDESSPATAADAHAGGLDRCRRNMAFWKRACAVFARTFAGLTWRRLAVCCLVLFGIALTKGPRMGLLQGDAQLALSLLGISVALVCAKYVPILLVVVAAANYGPRSGWRQIAWLIASIFVAQVAGSVVLALVVPVVAPGSQLLRMIDPSAPAGVQLMRWTGLMLAELAIAGTAGVCWFLLKRNSDASAALHMAQQDSEEAQREGAEARLQVMQAQIEPHFLFNTLASIRRLYETDPGLGRSMLHHLSSYLTASPADAPRNTLHIAQGACAGRRLSQRAKNPHGCAARRGDRRTTHAPGCRGPADDARHPCRERDHPRHFAPARGVGPSASARVPGTRASRCRSWTPAVDCRTYGAPVSASPTSARACTRNTAMRPACSCRRARRRA